MTVYSLPSAYQQVEYIGTDWWQYIDTWITSNNNNSFEMSIWGCSWSNWYILSQGNNSLRTQWTNYIRWFTRNCNIAWWFTSWEENKVEFWYNYLRINWVDGSKVNDSDSAAWNIRLFCRNTDTITWAIVKVWYCKIWDSSSNLVWLFVACYRKSDGVIWMYNTVNSTFYPNNWSGNFTKWDDVKKGTIINMVYISKLQ